MLEVHLEAENASCAAPGGGDGDGRLEAGFCLRLVWLGQFPAPRADPMSEDERLELLGTVAEAHAALSEATFKLR